MSRSLFILSRIRNIKNLGSSPPEVFFGKIVRKICNRFTGEHPCRSVIQINLQSNLIKIALWQGCSPVNLLHIFRKPFPKNIFERLLLKFLASLTSSNFGPLLPAGKNSNSLEVCDFRKKKRLSIKRNDLLTRTVIDAKIIRTGRDVLLITNCEQSLDKLINP